MAAFWSHACALVESDCVGEDTRVWAFSHVMPGARIGSHCNIGEHCYVESGSVIGNYVTLKNGVMVWDGVTLEDGVFVGPGAIFTNDLQPRSRRLPEAGDRYASDDWITPTLVRRGASIGAGAVVVCGRTLGMYSMVAAGSVITRDVADYALMVGNPARQRGWVCQCGSKLVLSSERFTCPVCSRSYCMLGSALAPRPSPAAVTPDRS